MRGTLLQALCSEENMNFIIKGITISSLLGMIVGFLMCYIGWQHNPQCELHCDGFVDWRSLFHLWLTWLVIVFVVGMMINLLLFTIYSVRNKQL